MNMYVCKVKMAVSQQKKKESFKEASQGLAPNEVLIYVRATTLAEALVKAEGYVVKSQELEEVLQIQKGIEITVD